MAKKNIDLISYEPARQKDLSHIDKFLKLISMNGKVTIKKRDVETAYFVPATSEIVLPVFAIDDVDLYMLMGSHEVSHALHTPTDIYVEHNSNNRGKNGTNINLSPLMFSCINIVEDIRIEKLIRKQYPGFVPNYRRGYTKLFAIITKKMRIDWEQQNIASRVNLKAKFGHRVPELTAFEYAVLKYLASAVTFDDVLIRSAYLYDLIKKESGKGGEKDKNAKGGESAGPGGFNGDISDVDENLQQSSGESGENGQTQQSDQQPPSSSSLARALARALADSKKQSAKNASEQDANRSETGSRSQNNDAESAESEHSETPLLDEFARLVREDSEKQMAEKTESEHSKTPLLDELARLIREQNEADDFTESDVNLPDVIDDFMKSETRTNVKSSVLDFNSEGLSQSTSIAKW